jgi:hypothetical protein
VCCSSVNLQVNFQTRTRRVLGTRRVSWRLEWEAGRVGQCGPCGMGQRAWRDVGGRRHAAWCQRRKGEGRGGAHHMEGKVRGGTEKDKHDVQSSDVGGEGGWGCEQLLAGVGAGG